MHFAQASLTCLLLASFVSLVNPASWLQHIVACLEEQQQDAEDARLIADPSIGVADLEKALDDYFHVMRYRNLLKEVLQLIKDEKVTWKTAPKAKAWDLA